MELNVYTLKKNPLSIRKSFGIYLGVLFLFVLSVLVFFSIIFLVLTNFKIESDSIFVWIFGILIFISYFVCGFLLNRKVLSELIQWNPVWKTIDNVTHTKMSHLVFWPISYPFLFTRILIYRL